MPFTVLQCVNKDIIYIYILRKFDFTNFPLYDTHLTYNI